jgi:Zn-finger nucleic acid-binding protein
MKCPIDSATLLMSERQGVEIDYCPECRGVWLDRGELDKLLRQADSEWDDDDRGGGRRQPDRHHDDRHDTRAPKKKKKGWLSEIFEME